LITNARSRPEKGMPEKLANELNDAANMRGGAIKKKTTCIAWRKRIRRSRIIGGNGLVGFRFLWHVRYRSKDEEYRHHGAHRCR
jgi:hypothetical protein